MAKFFQAVLVFGVVAVVLCDATPTKLDKIRTARNRFLARQEAADEDVPAPTAYPAAGFRPEVSFDLPTEGRLLAPANHYLPPLTDPAMFYSAPAEVYGPPAETYGPPNEVSDDEDENEKSVTEVPEDEPVEETETEGVPTEEVVTEEADQEIDGKEQQTTIENKADPETSEAKEDNFISERLVLTKGTSIIRAAKLKQFAPLTQKSNSAQQFYLINGSLYTIA